LVIDAATGAQKRLDVVENQRLVAYLGGDAIVESGALSKPGTMQRIDLATGAVRWTVQTKSYTSGLEPTTVRPTVVYAATGPGVGQGIPVPVREVGDLGGDDNWQQALAADGAGFVVLDDTNGKGTLYDGNGKAKINNAALPVKSSDWTIYAGVLIGLLNDKVSPGRVTVAGFGLDNNFGKRWEFPLAAGTSIDRIKPCGPKHVCVVFSVGGSYSIKSIDLSTGKETWPADLSTSSRSDLYLLGAGFVLGEDRFGSLSKPSLRDPLTSDPIRSLGSGRSYDTAVASGGKWVLMTGVRSTTRGSAWTVVAVDVTSGKMTSAVDVGNASATVESASVTGDLVAAIAKNHTMVIAKAPST
jgi:hypothetical protein